MAAVSFCVCCVLCPLRFDLRLLLLIIEVFVYAFVYAFGCSDGLSRELWLPYSVVVAVTSHPAPFHEHICVRSRLLVCVFLRQVVQWHCRAAVVLCI